MNGSYRTEADTAPPDRERGVRPGGRAFPVRSVTVGQVPVADPATRRVRVVAERCASCDFRPGNQNNLALGQLARIVATCLANEGHIVCHETGEDSGMPGAVCAGFAAHPAATARSLALRIAATGRITYQDPTTDPSHP